MKTQRGDEVPEKWELAYGINLTMPGTWARQICDCISDLARAQAEAEALRKQNEALLAPFAYGECERVHQLPKVVAKESIDHLIDSVDNANRYLTDRIVRLRRAALAASPESKEGQ